MAFGYRFWFAVLLFTSWFTPDTVFWFVFAHMSFGTFLMTLTLFFRAATTAAQTAEMDYALEAVAQERIYAIRGKLRKVGSFYNYGSENRSADRSPWRLRAQIDVGFAIWG